MKNKLIKTIFALSMVVLFGFGFMLMTKSQAPTKTFALSAENELAQEDIDEQFQGKWYDYDLDNIPAFRDYLIDLNYDLEDEDDLLVIEANLITLYEDALLLEIIEPLENDILLITQPKIQPFWESTPTVDRRNEKTHQTIARKAYDYVSMLTAYSVFYDSTPSNTVGDLENMRNNLTWFADWPDKYENSQGFYNNHFYHYWTGTNYWGNEDVNAKTKFTHWYEMAVVEYINGDTKVAFQNLGKAVHYMSDLAAPVHTGDRALGDSYLVRWADALLRLFPNHSFFEKRASERHDVIGNHSPSATYSSLSLEDMVEQVAQTSYNRYYSNYKTIPESELNSIIDSSFQLSVDAAASVLVKFAEEIEFIADNRWQLPQLTDNGTMLTTARSDSQLNGTQLWHAFDGNPNTQATISIGIATVEFFVLHLAEPQPYVRVRMTASTNGAVNFNFSGGGSNGVKSWSGDRTINSQAPVTRTYHIQGNNNGITSIGFNRSNHANSRVVNFHKVEVWSGGTYWELPSFYDENTSFGNSLTTVRNPNQVTGSLWNAFDNDPNTSVSISINSSTVEFFELHFVEPQPYVYIKMEVSSIGNINMNFNNAQSSKGVDKWTGEKNINTTSRVTRTYHITGKKEGITSIGFYRENAITTRTLIVYDVQVWNGEDTVAWVLPEFNGSNFSGVCLTTVRSAGQVSNPLWHMFNENEGPVSIGVGWGEIEFFIVHLAQEFKYIWIEMDASNVGHIDMDFSKGSNVGIKLEDSGDDKELENIRKTYNFHITPKKQYETITSIGFYREMGLTNRTLTIHNIKILGLPK